MCPNLQPPGEARRPTLPMRGQYPQTKQGVRKRLESTLALPLTREPEGHSPPLPIPAAWTAPLSTSLQGSPTFWSDPLRRLSTQGNK